MCSSARIQPRPSTATPASASPSPAVLGARPTVTSTVSASMGVSFICAGVGSLMNGDAPSMALTMPPSTRTSLSVRPSSQPMRRFFISRWSSALMSASTEGRGSRRFWPSTTVTLDPKA